MSTNPNNPPSQAQKVAISHYSRPDIQQAMFDFCKHRETIANFNNRFFAKRPDTFDYPSDILAQAKQGATSFHTSEEIWTNPLDINTGMTPEQYNQIRTGWDLVIDIDSPFLDYGKIAAHLLIEQLESHGIHNIGIKFSGSKGFHIIVPSKAFPEKVGDKLTREYFPEWPRAIAKYLHNKIKDKMYAEIFSLSTKEELEKSGELTTERTCPKCKKPTIKKKFLKYRCSDPKCKGEIEGPIKKRSTMLCPTCNAKMILIEEREVDFCEKCKISTATIEAEAHKVGGETRKPKSKFEIEEFLKSYGDSIDIVLVSSRHLFRAPYSLHEKTAYASIPLEKSQIQNFKPSDADPLKITKTKSFMPNAIEGEATTLLTQALKEVQKEKPKEPEKKYEGKGIDLKGITITENMFPPVITKLLKGIPKDGRKRALSLLLSFFTSLEFPQDYIEEKIHTWNKKNYVPLKQGYITSQIAWSLKNKRLPPNYDKPIYKEFGITSLPAPGIKNPINYTIKKAFQAKTTSTYIKPKNPNEI